MSLSGHQPNSFARFRNGSRCYFRLSLLCLFCLCLALLAPLNAHGFSPPRFPLTASPSDTVSLAGHLEAVTDPAGRLTLADVLSDATTRRFRPEPGFLNRGYTDETSWVRFAISPGSSGQSDWMLYLGPAFLDHLTVYVQEGADPALPSSYREELLGDHHPAAGRQVVHSGFVVPLRLAGGTPRMVYLRIRTTSSHNLKGWVCSPQRFLTWSDRNALFNGAFFGISVVMSLINAIYGLRLRKPLYGYYACFLLAVSSSYLGVEGLLPLLWPGGAHLVADYLTGYGLGLAFSFFALFAGRLFDTRVNRPLTHAYFRFTVVLGLATIPAVPLEWYNRLAPVVIGNGLFFIGYLNWLAVGLCRKRVVEGALFLTAFLASSIGAVTVLLRLVGLVPVNWFTIYSLEVGAVVSMVLMTLALVERVRAAEEKALTASRQAEQRAAELAKDMTVELVRKGRELEIALEMEREASQCQSRFVDMISHEYRTPLAIIRANLDIMEMLSADTGSPFSRNLVKMKRAVARLIEVLEVSLGRGQSGTVGRDPGHESIPVESFVPALVTEMGELWGEGRIVLEKVEGGGRLTGDPLLIKTAILNLVDNALKYSPDREPVRISLRCQGGEATLRVTDRGRGIAAEELERVFERHYRGAGSADVTGAGVGLSLVLRIVEQYGGSVSLDSPPEGGTVATVRLPVESVEVFG
ncbi:sensor histidine kinase [Geomonas sp. Red32]|uniref:sensor histidine kinase n=1 Tax=Geomonas sp. Red32 TaxID=2912856 RepID=UPI00202CEF20|nr:sensor histidine kinase [Geomonas sp. Red32]MCM0082113.1 sensor histidine kinase [Geomonas sp. Red32]